MLKKASWIVISNLKMRRNFYSKGLRPTWLEASPSWLPAVSGLKAWSQGVPGGSVVKNPPAGAGDTGSIPGSGRSPGEGNGSPLQYSCLGNPMVRGAWRATVHGVTRVKHDLGTKPPPLSYRRAEKDTPVSIKNVKIEDRPTRLWLCGGENIFVY